ncbi:hypothetical protein VAEKB19_6870001 [Vibrio aestuarianus]|nr:hypothetical protein VAEKB19_6870001 [Vibrio aestuarianus]
MKRKNWTWSEAKQISIKGGDILSVIDIKREEDMTHSDDFERIYGYELETLKKNGVCYADIAESLINAGHITVLRRC